MGESVPSTRPYMGQIVHFVPPQFDMQPDSKASGIVERPAVVIEVDGSTVCLQSFNRTGLYFGQHTPHDPAGGEWSWHTAKECPVSDTDIHRGEP